ncbi:MAG TPA: hypothetical protein VFS29_03465 [Motilibacteraceae bacterium]|nr:hypothetical protein [Motilibacteraceae bacterium]
MAPPLPDDVTADELPREVRRELQTLPEGAAAAVGRRLAMAARVVEDDPELAYQHTLAAQRMAGRVGAVREATGLAAYAAGHWGVALTELRAAKRITGSEAYLPVMADCERGLGRPERALELAASPEAARLDDAGKVELRIVASGARRDLGQLDAAVVTLQGGDLTPRRPQPWTARLRYAYADALAAAGRTAEAERWFERTLEVDRDGETDAAERLAELQGLTFVDLGDSGGDEIGDSGGDDEIGDDEIGDDEIDEIGDDEIGDEIGDEDEVAGDRTEDLNVEGASEPSPAAGQPAARPADEVEDAPDVAAVASERGAAGEQPVATVDPSAERTFSHVEPETPVAPPAATAPAVVFQPAEDSGAEEAPVVDQSPEPAPTGPAGAAGRSESGSGSDDERDDRQEGTLF